MQGLKGSSYNKLQDQSFLDEIYKHHIIGLTETHSSPGEDITVSGYTTFQSNRQKSKQKAHGGLAFLVHNDIRPGVRFIPGSSNDIIWALLKREFFGIKEDLYIGLVYFSPANSTYSKKLECSPFDIEKYNSKGQILLMGDFNARTSNTSDLVATDRGEHIPVLQCVGDEDVFERKSEDCGRVCTYGNSLINLCIASSLRIANGRVLGDTKGSYTCHKYNGSSLVDYVLVGASTMSRLRYLRVHEFFGDLSDHCLLSFGLAVNTQSLRH